MELFLFYAAGVVPMAALLYWLSTRGDGRRRELYAWAQQRGYRFDAEAPMGKVLGGLPRLSGRHAKNITRLERDGLILRVFDAHDVNGPLETVCVVTTPERRTPNLGLRPHAPSREAARIARRGLRQLNGFEVTPEVPTVTLDDDADFMSAWAIESRDPATARNFLSARLREGLLRLREKQLTIECDQEHVAVTRCEATRPEDLDALIADALQVRQLLG